MIARTGTPSLFRPRLVLAYADSAHAAQCARQFRRQGWEVHQAGSGIDARRLVADLDPQVVVLDVDLPDGSGWLTAVKLRLENPGQRVYLTGASRTPEHDRLAAFIGAAGFITRQDGVDPLADQLVPCA
jgi:DNA-binding response OmpR family regulator